MKKQSYFRYLSLLLVLVVQVLQTNCYIMRQNPRNHVSYYSQTKFTTFLHKPKHDNHRYGTTQQDLGYYYNKQQSKAFTKLNMIVPVDPVEAYLALAGFAKDSWYDRRKPKDPTIFSYELDSDAAYGVYKALKEHLLYKPFAVCDSIELDYFRGWFKNKRIGEWMKFLGESVDEEALKVALRNKCIPVDALIKTATPAVFGKGNETVYDTNVRKAWDIPADRLCNGDNDLFIYDMPVDNAIRSKIEDAMKPNEATWSYKLYKMHLYGPGDKFLPHVDTLHASNHVATVIVGLPIQHSGGSLLVKHRDNAVKFDLSNDNINCAKYCAFFTDCPHEVEEVASGWRIVLQYDVYQENLITAVRKNDKEDEDHEDKVEEEDDEEDKEAEEEEQQQDEDKEDEYEYDDDDEYEEQDYEYEYEEEEDDDDDEYEEEDDEYEEEDDEYEEEEEEDCNQFDVLIDKWQEGVGSTSSIEKIAVAVPNKNLEDAVISYLGKKNPNDRLAILLHHQYSLLALQDCVLKGTDCVVYDAFMSEKWTRKLQGVVINTECSDDWGNDLTIPISLEDFALGDDKSKCYYEDDVNIDDDEDSNDDGDMKKTQVEMKNIGNGKTYVLPYGRDPPCGRELVNTPSIDFTGNSAQNAFASYFMTCLVLEYKPGIPSVL